MVLQVQGSGSTVTDGTVQVLHTSTFVGVQVVQVDLSPMQAGDTLVLKVNTKVLTGSSEGIFIEQTFTGVQTEPVIQSEPVASPHSYAATLQQTGGVYRTFDWSVNSV